MDKEYEVILKVRIFAQNISQVTNSLQQKLGMGYQEWDKMIVSVATVQKQIVEDTQQPGEVES